MAFKKSKKLITVEINGLQVPVKIIRESRSGYRASIGKDSLIVRLPSSPFFYVSEKDAIQRLKDWLDLLLLKKPNVLDRFKIKEYQDGQEVIVRGTTFQLLLNKSSNKNHSAKIVGKTIQINLVPDDERSRPKAIKTLLSRVLANRFKPELERRLHELNQQFFQQKYSTLRLKYTSSNWGSCSSKGNINLSTRLLFAPEDVVDYVMIHELAHLKEANHSARFWELVADAMPNYKEKERWLKTNGHLCDF